MTLPPYSASEKIFKAQIYNSAGVSAGRLSFNGHTNNSEARIAVFDTKFSIPSELCGTAIGAVALGSNYDKALLD